MKSIGEKVTMRWAPFLLVVLVSAASSIQVFSKTISDEHSLDKVNVHFANSPVQEDTIAFMAELQEDLTASHDVILKLSDVKLDTGGNYNPALGIFRCPVGGWYLFMWTVHAVERRLFTHTQQKC